MIKQKPISCEAIQERLAEQGAEALREDKVLSKHVEECEACFSVFEALGELDNTLKSLPLYDPPAAMIAATLERIAATPVAVSSPDGEVTAADSPRYHGITARIAALRELFAPLRERSRGWLATVLAALRFVAPSAKLTRNILRPGRVIATCASLAIVLVVATTFLNSSLTTASRFSKVGNSISGSANEVAKSGTYSEANFDDSLVRQTAQNLGVDKLLGAESEEQDYADVDAPREAEEESGAAYPEARPTGRADANTRLGAANAPRQAKPGAAPPAEAPVVRANPAAPPPFIQMAQDGASTDDRFAADSAGEYLRDAPPVPKPLDPQGGYYRPQRGQAGASETVRTERFTQSENKEKAAYDQDRRPTPAKEQSTELARPRSRRAGGEGVALDELKDSESSPEPLEERALLDKKSSKNLKKDESEAISVLQTAPPSAPPTTLAFGGASEHTAGKVAGTKRAEIPGNSAQPVTGRGTASRLLPHQPTPIAPTGYWLNTYIPGTPTIARLEQRVHALEASPARRALPLDVPLHLLARQLPQPFDVPDRAALGLHVHGELLAVDGPTRMILQVGLQGTDRRSGRRPAMNIAVILDLTSPGAPQTLEMMRALVFSLNERKDIGDRFQLYVAGPDHQDPVPPADFRHGPLTLLFQSLSKQHGGRSAGSMIETYQRAADALLSADDPNAPLGSSGILLVTPGTLGGDLGELQTAAHRSAVGGISTSVVSIGRSPADLSELVLLGQGSAYSANAPDDARTIVERELTRVSRNIAKAIRLRIRFAPGVKFFGIVGSHRLEEPQAQRVREMEQSVDRSLSKALGIASDRGEDEEGIQIVIPAFYSGDSHVILLDVEVPGPGPVADARVRYKDLVNLNNAVATSTFAVTSGSIRRNPLEVSVVKNTLALTMAEALRRSSTAGVYGSQTISALSAIIDSQKGAVTSAIAIEPALRADKDIAQINGFLDRAAAILASPASGRPELQQYLAQSLSLAAFNLAMTHPSQETEQ